MSRIYSNYDLPNGTKLYYEIIQKDGVDNGFNIYDGDRKYPYLHQPEPFIPDHSLSYEENAIKMCEELSQSVTIPYDNQVRSITNKEYDQLVANMDYLLLLSE